MVVGGASGRTGPPAWPPARGVGPRPARSSPFRCCARRCSRRYGRGAPRIRSRAGCATNTAVSTLSGWPTRCRTRRSTPRSTRCPRGIWRASRCTAFGRTRRRPRSRHSSPGARIVGMTSIVARPAEASDLALPVSCALYLFIIKSGPRLVPVAVGLVLQPVLHRDVRRVPHHHVVAAAAEQVAGADVLVHVLGAVGVRLADLEQLALLAQHAPPVQQRVPHRHVDRELRAPGPAAAPPPPPTPPPAAGTGRSTPRTGSCRTRAPSRARG